MVDFPKLYITELRSQLLDLRVYISVSLINRYLGVRVIPAVSGGVGRGVRKKFHPHTAPEIAANYFFTEDADYRKSVKRVGEIRCIALQVEMTGATSRDDIIKDSGFVKKLQLESDLTLFYVGKWLSIKWGSMLSLYEGRLQDDLRKAYRDRHEANRLALKHDEQSPQEKAAQDRIDEIEREKKRWQFLKSEMTTIFIDIKSGVLDGEGELVG